MAPMWMASPPEVHSALLSSGPGPGSLLAAAAAWTSLSAEHAEAADELTAVLNTVRGEFWEGPSAEQYLTAHIPYLAWLTRAGAISAENATRHEIAASAYTTALAAMPTLPELATNHVVHGTLVATNFFGINTIPIAVNEADYVRMWMQAAATMATYEGVSDAALASAPRTDRAPQPASGSAPGDEGTPTTLDYAVAEFLRTVSNGRVNWDPVVNTLNGVPFEQYTDASDPYWYVARAIEFPKDFETFLQDLVVNPQEALQSYFDLLLFDYPEHIPQLLQALIQSPALVGVAFGATATNLAAGMGLAGLAGLAAIKPAAVSAIVAPVAPASPMMPAAGTAPGAVTVAPAAPPPAPALLTSTVPSGGPAIPPPSAPAAPGVSYPFLVGGGPGIGSGSGMGSSASERGNARKSATESNSGAATLEAAARARSRRRRRGALHEHGDEFMDMNVDVNPEWAESQHPAQELPRAASDSGAGILGFAGTVITNVDAAPTGTNTLAQDEFDSSPKLPMLPGTWKPDDRGVR